MENRVTFHSNFYDFSTRQSSPSRPPIYSTSVSCLPRFFTLPPPPISLLYRTMSLYPLSSIPLLHRSVPRIFRALSSDHVLESVLELPRVVTFEEEGEKKYNAVATRSVALRVLQGDDKAGLEMWYRVLRPCCCSLTVYTRKQIANFRG